MRRRGQRTDGTGAWCAHVPHGEARGGGRQRRDERAEAWPLPAHHAAEVMSLGLGDGYQHEPLLLIVIFSVLQPS